MKNLGDHTTNRRRIRQLGDPADLVEIQPDQRRTLRMVAADRAAGLFDLDRLSAGHVSNSWSLKLRDALNFDSADDLVGRRLGIAADATGLQGRHLDVAARRD